MTAADKPAPLDEPCIDCDAKAGERCDPECPNATDSDLDRLLEMARQKPVSAAEREQQRRSFAYGNTNIENARITRAMIDRAAEQLASQPVQIPAKK